MAEEKEQWYTNKDLFEMVQGLQNNIADLNTAMKETAVLIRDYNGLRKEINECKQKLWENEGKTEGGHSVWGYVVGGIGLLMALISFTVR